MSIKIMSIIWEHGPSAQSDRFVLLALADYANDEGEAWPSIAGICRKTCMSERGVQTVIRRLEAAGWVTIQTGAGRKNCNQYTIKTPQQVHPLPDKNPAGDAPAGDAPPQMDAETPQMTAKNPAGDAPEPSENHQEPSSTKSARTQVRETLEHEASPEAVASFIAYRSKTKAKALTVTAAKRLAASLRAIIDGGGCADDALGLAEERGWQTVKPDWYFRETRNDNRTHPHRHAATGTDAGDRIIAFAARAGRAPSSDCF